MSRPSRTDLAAAGGLLPLTRGFFKGVLVGRVLVPWDIIRANPLGAGGSIHNGLLSDPVRLYAPWGMLLADGLRHGHLPWWNPYVFAGNPFFANSQAALLYPPNLLYGLLPTDRATTVLILGHTLWAGLGAYLLAGLSLGLAILTVLLARFSPPVRRPGRRRRRLRSR